MKTIGMLSGTEMIAQKFASGPMRAQLPERTGAVNVRQPVAQGDRLLDRPRTSCQEVSSLLSALQQRELNAGRQSRRSEERRVGKECRTRLTHDDTRRTEVSNRHNE